MSDFLKKFGDDLRKNIPGFIAVTITEVRSVKNYFSYSEDASYDAELSSRFYLEIVRAKMNAITATSLKNEKISTILIYLTSQIHFIDVSDDGEFFIYLTLKDNKNFNLGITKMHLKNYILEIKQLKQKK